MIVTLSGITGIGKSFFKNVIIQELGIKNLVIVTTREKRKDEIDGIDKIFVSDKEFEKMKKDQNILFDFEFLGAKYGYKREYLESKDNFVTEVHYDTIYGFRQKTKDVFAIYMIPSDLNKAIEELKKRGLPKKVEEDRLKEIKEHIEIFSKNKDLQNQFDYILVNDYTDNSKKELLNIIKQKIKKQEVKI